MLLGMVSETTKMSEYFAGVYPDIFAMFADMPVPSVSFLSALDWHLEAGVTDRMDDKHSANEWDGVVAFAAPNGDKKCFLSMTANALPTEITRKTYPCAVDLAKEKYPLLDWSEISSMPTAVYRAKWTEVQRAIRTGRVVDVSNIDTVVGEVMIGRQDCSLAKNHSDTFELFRNGKWEMNINAKALCLEIKEELAYAFGSTCMTMCGNEEVESRVPPRPPFQKDDFIAKIAACTMKYIEAHRQSPLDHNMWGKLLFPDNLVYDFSAGVMRKQLAADRLYRHTNRPFQEFRAPDDLKAAIAEFAQMLCKFFLLDGTNLTPTTDDEATHENAELAELRRRILACWKFIHQHDCSIGIRALANVLCENITDLDDIVWVLRQEARVADISWIPFFKYVGIKTSQNSAVWWVKQSEHHKRFWFIFWKLFRC